ncbi:hypothetical protein EJP77_10225 [Paenibacillus zeisoli]|uniref:SLH domain-containing protein n=1 Tax=Paenibacillus zeisoli TaxID=2496267 RepID=A0A433XCU1_9BACL|nr:S-layer homology domain-containing protein [Paenibacillus zeisoli]RUT31754.1 hypothetical protein EJP77_10225 [Paenibacillus zeisoli]
MFRELKLRKVSVFVLVSMLLLGMLQPGGIPSVQAASEAAAVTSPEFNQDGTVTVRTYSLKSEMYINGNFTNWGTFKPMTPDGTVQVNGVDQNVFSYQLSTEDFNKTGGVVQYKFIPQASWSGGDYVDFLNNSPKVGGNSAAYFLKVALNQKQLQAGQSTPVEAFRYLSDGSKADLTGADVTWTSSKPESVTILNGKAEVAPGTPVGTVTITGVYQGVSATTALEIVDTLPVPKVKSAANLTDLNDRLMIGEPTPEITGEVEAEDITNVAGKGNNVVAQLGYRYETDPDYTWVNAVYKDDVGNSDRFGAHFTPDRAGKWYYAMRFSLDNGITWDQKILGYKVNKFYDEQTILKPFDVLLTWTGDAKTTQTITWKTDSNVARNYVQYAEKSSVESFPGVNISVEGQAKPYKTTYVTANVNVFSATLTGLKPGTAYVYRVGDGANWSDTATFTTEAAAAAPFKFLIFGDSQSGRQEETDYRNWGETVNTAYQANPGVKFMVNNGDVVEKGSYEHWHKWFEGAQGVIENIPEMPATGNHEYYSTYGVNEQADNFKMQFNLPQNGPDRLKGLVYSYDYGDVHFTVLNSQNTEANTDQSEKMGDILAEQAAWLDNDLKSTNKKWKIVFYHKASYYSRSSRDVDAEVVKKAFQPIIDKYHVDLVFGGHDHTITRSYPINNNNFVDNTSKGTVYYITGRSGNKNYNDPFKQVWDAYYKNDTDDTNYLLVSVDGENLTVKATEKNGNVLDSYTLNKTTGTPSPDLPKIPIEKAENLSALTKQLSAGTKTDDITAEVSSQNVTNYVGRGVNIQAQLGYKLSEDAQYTWVNADYAQDAGKNDVYRANFVPNKAGNWDYVMRFSGDGGLTWTSTDAKIVKAIANNSGGSPGTGGGGQPTPATPSTPATPTTPAAPTVPDNKPEPGKVNPFQSKVINEEKVIQAIKDSIAAAKDTAAAFGDIAQHWGRNDIALAVKLGIVKGYENVTFRPDAPVTRAEFAAMVCRAFGMETVQGSASFRDTADIWASGYIGTLASKGVINGYTDQTFRPNKEISRAEMVTILGRILDLGQLATSTKASLTDVGSDYWAKNAIEEAYKAQLIQGVNATLFKPDDRATRAEAITVLLRALKSDSSIKQLIEQQ